MFFAIPDDARWNAERQTVEFGVEIGEYHAVVRLPRRVFQRLLPDTPTPERSVEAYHLQRTRFERVAERKLRRRQLTEDRNVEITGRDLREDFPMASRRIQTAVAAAGEMFGVARPGPTRSPQRAAAGRSESAAASSAANRAGSDRHASASR
jgi:hypothetical protein